MFSKRYNELSIIIIGVLLILVAFGSQVYPAYVVLDDAIRIYENYAKDPHTIRTALAFGRPINALFLNYSYKLLPGLQNIQYIRLISVAGVCASFVILYRLLQDFFPQPGRFVISFSTVLLPPFIVVTLIGAADSYPFAYLCGLGAALALEGLLRRIDFKAPSGRIAREAVTSPRFMLAFVLLSFGLFNYPPAAQVIFCLPVLYICRFNANDDLHKTTVCCILTCALFLVAATFFYGVWKLYQAYFFSDVDIGKRTIITSLDQLQGKVEWFFGRVLPDVGNFFNLTPSVDLAPLVWVAVSSYAVIAFYFILLPASPKERLIRACLWLSLLPATYLANLLAQESWSEFRTQFAIQTYVWLTFAGALWQWSSRALALSNNASFTPLRNTVAVLLCLCLAFRQAFIVGPTLTRTHVDELLVVRDAVRDFEKARKPDTRLVVVRPYWDANAPALIRYDLIGVPTTGAFWVAIPLVKIVYLELYRRPFPVPVVDVPVKELPNFEIEPDDYVMNLDTLLRAHAKLRLTPMPKVSP